MKNKKIPTAVKKVIPSYEEWLEEMGKKPWTFDWDVLLAFDRNATNTLLMQEFIDRFTNGSYFPAVPDDLIDMGGNLKHALVGFVLGKPRLSFENARIESSAARLTMRMVGGKQLQLHENYHDGKPVRSVRQLAIVNAVAGPTLLADINLLAVQGDVDDEGKVILDLANGVNYKFTGVESQFEQQLMGQHIESILKKWAEQGGPLTSYQLSNLTKSDGSIFEPGYFGLRTHAAPGATVRGAAEYGNGEVLLFIAMKGSPNGKYPAQDKDLLYMLPKATPPYTSNLLIGQKFLLEKVALDVFRQAEFLKDGFELRQGPDPESRAMLVSNVTRTATLRGIDEKDEGGLGKGAWWTTLKVDKINMDMLRPNLCTFEFEDGVIKAKFKVGITTTNATYMYNSMSGWGLPRFYSVPISIDYAFEAEFFYETELRDGRAFLVFKPKLFKNLSEVSYPSSSQRGWNSMLRKAVPKLEPDIKFLLENHLGDLATMSGPIDALRLNNLMFQGDNVVEPRTVALPADFTLLGNLAPNRVTLVISPVEVTVVAGHTHVFEATGAIGTVTWTVENLPGETGATGTVVNGIYTAPARSTLLEDGQRRVLVVAKNGSLISKALVSIVQTDISLYPLVASVNLGQKLNLSAATPDSAAITWTQPAAQFGSIAPDTDPLNPGGQVFTAAVKLPDHNGSTDPLYYLGVRHVPISVKRAAGGESVTLDVLLMGNRNSNYWLVPTVNSNGSVGIEFFRNTRNGVEPVKGVVEWTLIKGDGTFDENGKVYTPKAGSQEQYAIIVAFYDNGVDADTYDVLILPIPFVAVKKYKDLLDPSVKRI